MHTSRTDIMTLPVDAQAVENVNRGRPPNVYCNSLYYFCLSDTLYESHTTRASHPYLLIQRTAAATASE